MCGQPLRDVEGPVQGKDGPRHPGVGQRGVVERAQRATVAHDDLSGDRLDTLEPGRHGGAFCEERARWLAGELAAHSATPTLIFMHHPPVVAGIDWMDPAPDEPWIMRLHAVLHGQTQVQAIHCGHLHRPITTRFAGLPLGVTPSVAPLVAMDLSPIDQDVPDNRELITTEPPTYALHRWDGTRLVSHYERVGDWQVLARFHAGLQPMIRGMFAERD